eukprot:COSAG06_NODE_1920_length_8063_cov_14.050854_2_plen_87_part_00
MKRGEVKLGCVSRNPRQRCWTLCWLQIAKQLAAFPSYILLNRTVLSVRNEAKGVQYQTLASTETTVRKKKSSELNTGRAILGHMNI